MNIPEDLTGKVFGDLKVLWKHKQSANGGATWVCKCNCGHIDIVQGNRLTSGHKTHCSYCTYGRFRFFDGYKKVECILPDGSSFSFDFNDFPLVSRYRWSRMKNGYFRTSLGSRKAGHELLHRLIMQPPEGMVVDHIDGDKSNCCRENLRICSNADNTKNSSIHRTNTTGYKGVSYDPRRNIWSARICDGNQKMYIGSFNSPEKAAEAYDNAALEIHGEYAKTNRALGLI